MVASVGVGLRKRRAALCVTLVSCQMLLSAGAAQAANAADCPHPGALGTSRTLVVDPRAHPLIGTMQYRETLPLADHEVVLTFDDGPLPKNSNQVLDILAGQCVKATFFLIGSQAKANPEGVRKVRDAGHTVATHTQNHPFNMQRLPIERARQEVDDGIASVTAALGDSGAALAPFFRIPGLSRADGIEEYAKSKGLQVWSADFPADDWRHVSSHRVYELAIQRLEAHGKGILLLHDIQARTVAALPRILQELKTRGYRIVHVVPASAELPATPTEPQQWLMHPPTETVAIARWPKIPNFVFADPAMLPAPGLYDLELRDDRRKRAFPAPSPAPVAAASTLAVPAASVFTLPEALSVTRLAVANRPQPVPVAAGEAKPAAGAAAVRSHASASRPIARGKHAARPARAAPRHAAGKPVHVASLKKRGPKAAPSAD